MQDSEVYSIVLNRLDPTRCALINDESLLARAGKAINNAKAIGADVFLKPKVSILYIFTYYYFCLKYCTQHNLCLYV